MRWASVLSLQADLEAALADALARLDAELDGAAPDLLVAFVSAAHEASFPGVPALLRRSRARVIVGCSAGGVIAAGREIEGSTAVGLVAAVLPGVEVAPCHLETDRLPALDERERWRGMLHVATDAADDAHVLLLADPFTADVERLLAGLDRHLAGGRKVGGLASGGSAPGRTALFAGDTLHRSGVVAVTLAGDVAVQTIVAQGCRPIGDPMFATGVQGNVLRTLDGEPAGRVLRRLYDRLEGRDKELFRDSLFIGVVMREARETYRHGDFLIRNIVGLDAASGTLVVGTSLQEGTIVQFHLRDATTSAEDLDALASRQVAAAAPHPAGALLFSCLGRGAQLYGRPDHDSEAFHRHFGDVPLGGFFCNGEIGPVQGATFVHGYTSSFALFSPRQR